MAKDFHSATVVAGYDSHIRKLIPGYELVHQHINAILSSHLPETAQVLVVGCGTAMSCSIYCSNIHSGNLRPSTHL